MKYYKIVAIFILFNILVLLYLKEISFSKEVKILVFVLIVLISAEVKRIKRKGKNGTKINKRK